MLFALISILTGCTVQTTYTRPPAVEYSHVVVYHHEPPQYYVQQHWVAGHYTRNGYWVSGHWVKYETLSPPPVEHRVHPHPHRHRR